MAIWQCVQPPVWPKVRTLTKATLSTRSFSIHSRHINDTKCFVFFFDRGWGSELVPVQPTIHLSIEQEKGEGVGDKAERKQTAVKP